jgi:hypothetical protein
MVNQLSIVYIVNNKLFSYDAQIIYILQYNDNDTNNESRIQFKLNFQSRMSSSSTRFS